VTPAIVYFPPGLEDLSLDNLADSFHRTYLVSTPIIAYYYTELVGDAINPPVCHRLPNLQFLSYCIKFRLYWPIPTSVELQSLVIFSFHLILLALLIIGM